MSDESVKGTLARVDSLVFSFLDQKTRDITDLKESVFSGVYDFRDDTSLLLAKQEASLIKATTLIGLDAEYHLLRAYHHASPSLIAIIIGIYTFITTVIKVIQFINKFLGIVTGENLAYWLDQLIPGFLAFWNDAMNKIADVASQLGWGAGAIIHLFNIANLANDTFGVITGKGKGFFDTNKIQGLEFTMRNVQSWFNAGKANPGEMIQGVIDAWSTGALVSSSEMLKGWTDKITSVTGKAEDILKNMGGIGDQLLSLRNDMPSIIAQNIPSSIWNWMTIYDSAINDRILPRLDKFESRVTELSNILDETRATASRLSDRISHPGDLLKEIDALPDYLRAEQEDKINDIAMRTTARANTSMYANFEAGLAEFDKTYAALQANIPSPSIFLLEIGEHPEWLPSQVTLRKNWFVGDF